jgi:hypothetical protein
MAEDRNGPQPGSRRGLPQTPNSTPIPAHSTRNRASEIISSVRIGDVWRALGGGALHHGYGRAFWRGGNGFNVRLYDERGRWRDFARDDKGGILDLVQRVRGCDRVTALRWLAAFAGMALEDKPFSAGERQSWARRKAEFDRDLPTARLWRRAGLSLCDQDLSELKAAIFSSKADSDPSDIRKMEQVATTLQATSDAALVKEYRWWRANHPAMTAGMVMAAEKLERVEHRALDRFLDSLEEGVR